MNTEVIRSRKSVRTYRDQPILEDTMRRVRDCLDHGSNPFGVDIQFSILDAKADGVGSPVVVGTDTFVAGKVRRQPNAELSYGYELEGFVLYATYLGLGTVWLAATMDRKAFERAIRLADDEVMPAVTPIGYPAYTRSVREGLMRKGMRSDTRLPFEELFFRGDFDHPLERADAGSLERPLEMVRWAPSATNKQPWRVIVDDGGAHFFERRTKGYDREATGDIQKVDVGIALRHFEVAAREAGLAGSIVQGDPGIATAPDVEYVATYELG